MGLDGWYALQVRPRFEKSVGRHLEEKGYEQFVPLYVSRRRWSDRTKNVELPLIPSYVFCRITPDATAPVLTTPGVIRIVGAGNEPIPLDDTEVESLRRVSAANLRTGPCPFIGAGEKVRITAGPLRGVEGRVCRLANHNRLIVSISLLQRSVAVDLDAGDVEVPTQFVPFEPRSFQAVGQYV